jgi:FdrA protein
VSAVRCEIRRGAYFDSVVLLQLQKGIAALDGVEEAGVVMATPANREILKESGLLTGAAEDAQADDLLIAVRARDDGAAVAALAAVEGLLRARRGAASDAGEEEDPRPRSLVPALRALPAANWVLVSVPGRYAAAVAREALAAGRNVFLYSDNVTLDEEVALKREAAARGLLVLGPDCGTAILGGVGLGFANRVRRGAIGIVAASGTGLQAVASRVHELGEGISHALGTGGRDLSAEVGGATALAALELLARDAPTRVIVLLSKPPAPEVATKLLAAARTCGKPVVVNFIGHAAPGRKLGELHFASALADAADLAVDLARTRHPDPSAGARDEVVGDPSLSLISHSLVPSEAEGTGRGKTTGATLVRGLFSGGTLAYETLLALRAVLGRVDSNLSHDEVESDGHRVLDLGADEFTVGRPHPMIDQDMLLRRLREEASDPRVGVILLDVVLGYGAHPDPSAELGPAIAEARDRARREGRELRVVALLVGTGDDPQDREAQAERLRGAGAEVVSSPGEAVESAWSVAAPAVAEADGGGARGGLAAVVAVNVGVELFHAALRALGVAWVLV